MENIDKVVQLRTFYENIARPIRAAAIQLARILTTMWTDFRRYLLLMRWCGSRAARQDAWKLLHAARRRQKIKGRLSAA